MHLILYPDLGGKKPCIAWFTYWVKLWHNYDVVIEFVCLHFPIWLRVGGREGGNTDVCPRQQTPSRHQWPQLNKKISYCQVTVQCSTSVEISSTSAKLRKITFLKHVIGAWPWKSLKIIKHAINRTQHVIFNNCQMWLSSVFFTFISFAFNNNK